MKEILMLVGFVVFLLFSFAVTAHLQMGCAAKGGTLGKNLWGVPVCMKEVK